MTIPETKYTVLIVDDAPENIQVISAMLYQRGLNMMLAQNGREALNVVTRKPPDLILLDIVMPEMDGFAVCAHLKSQPETVDIPVIFLTGKTNPEKIVKAFEVGAVDYVTKPFNPQELLSRVLTHLELTKTRNLLVVQNQQLAEQNRELQELSALKEQHFSDEIRESEKRFRSTFEQAAVGIVHATTDGHFLKVNQRFCDIIGYPEAEMLRISFQEITHPEDVDTDLARVQELLEGTLQTFSMEKRYICKDTSIIWVNLTMSPVRNASGHPEYFIGVVEDITQRKQAEEQLHYQADLLQNVSDAIISTDLNFIIQSWNAAAERIYGYAETDVIGKSVSALLRKVFLEESHEEMVQILRETGRWSGEVRQTRKDGTSVSIQSSVSFIKDRAGNPIGAVAVNRDITERRRAEQTLRTSEQQYRLLAQRVPDGIGIVQQEILVFVNKALSAMLGYRVSQCLERTPDDVFRDPVAVDIENADERIPQSPSDVQGWPVLRNVVTGDGREVWTEERYSTIVWEGKPALLMTVRDITKRKLREIVIEEERNTLRKEVMQLRSTMKDRYRFGDIVGKSQVMQAMYELILKTAASEKEVVICGESGTGKELIARTIHRLSTRQGNAFVSVNCGAIPEPLFEREFFGHRKGAFTGADRDARGFFDAAHNGTLFLDEVGELTPAMQVKLLRAIESGEYTPLGESRSKTTNARIIAATNRNLKEAVEKNMMREDFFYRIHVIVMTVPPLRERREDIPLLIDHFAQQYKDSPTRASISGTILEALYNYNWPGNIRQLQNVLYRYFTVGQLDFAGPRHVESVESAAGSGTESMPNELTLHQSVEQLEKRVILRTLEQHHWNRTTTAAALGIPRSTLRRKINKYELL